MTSETDTAFDEDVTDNAQLSDDDNSEDFDYFDPDEDLDTEEAEATEETEVEPDEEEAEEEADPQEAVDQSDEDEPIEDYIAKLKAETPRVAEYLEELERGNLRQSDYSRKTQELANVRKSVDADAQRMTRITEALVEQISAFVPDAPDVSLAYSDPAKYTAQKAQHEAAMAQVQNLMKLADEPKDISAQMSDADRKTAAREANDRLVAVYPEAIGGEGRQKFFEGVAKVADSLGFTSEELTNNTDERFFILAHKAAQWDAAQAATVKAKEKVAKAPPSTPRKPGQGARKANGNAAAMRKLNQSGSLRDALAIDFD